MVQAALKDVVLQQQASQTVPQHVIPAPRAGVAGGCALRQVVVGIHFLRDPLANESAGAGGGELLR